MNSSHWLARPVTPGNVCVYSCALALYTARSSISLRIAWPVEPPTAAAKATTITANAKALNIWVSPNKQRYPRRSNKTKAKRRDLQRKD